MLRKELHHRGDAGGLQPEWGDVLRDLDRLQLDRLQEVTLQTGGKTTILRTPASGVAGHLFQAARVALPPTMREPAA